MSVRWRCHSSDHLKSDRRSSAAYRPGNIMNGYVGLLRPPTSVRWRCHSSGHLKSGTSRSAGIDHPHKVCIFDISLVKSGTIWHLSVNPGIRTKNVSGYTYGGVDSAEAAWGSVGGMCGLAPSLTRSSLCHQLCWPSPVLNVATRCEAIHTPSLKWVLCPKLVHRPCWFWTWSESVCSRSMSGLS